MGGQPRTTSGSDALQDGSTPAEFIAAVERRFGPIQYDLAAHATNAKHARYFAPPSFKVRLKEPKFGGDLVERLVARGADRQEARAALFEGINALSVMTSRQYVDVTIPNRDPRASGFDGLKQEWAKLSGCSPGLSLYNGRPLGVGSPGLLWLNCEWADIDPWAAKCAFEAQQGANVLLLTHVAITDWFTDHIARKADVMFLKGRLSFDGGKNVLPKDCMLSHFWPGQAGRMEIWDWRNDTRLRWVLRGWWNCPPGRCCGGSCCA